jgi:hypothetical protein
VLSEFSPEEKSTLDLVAFPALLKEFGKYVLIKNGIDPDKIARVSSSSKQTHKKRMGNMSVKSEDEDAVVP